MQCLRIWFTFWLFAISVNILVASPVDILNVDDKNVGGDLNTAESNQDEAVISERDNEVGYLRRADEKGADAYQHFESFHDKDGDAYGYEKHEAYGKSNKGESLNDGKDKNEGSHYNYVQELGDKPKYQKYQGSNDDPGKSNYHYSYNSADDENDDNKDEHKPKHSSNYQQQTKGNEDSDDEDENDDDNDVDNHGSDEEKTTNFRYKIVSDDYEEDDGHGDINSKKNDDDDHGFHFGHGDKNTKVDYTVKKSDFIAGYNDDKDDDDDGDDDDDDGNEKDDDEEHGSEGDDEDNVIVKNQKINDDEGKAKNSKSYSTYTTFSSQEGDDEEDDDEGSEKSAETDNKPSQKEAIRYENSYPINNNNEHSTNQRIVVNDDSEEENDESDDEDVDEDVELHQSAPRPRPTKPVELVKEHRTEYVIENHVPEVTSTKTQTVIQPSTPIVLVQEHRAGYKVEESGGDKGSDDNGKGHGGTISKHLYEIYVTHDTGKSNGGGGDGGKGSDNDDDDGGDGKGKSENLVLQQPQKVNDKGDGNDNGTYKVNINYGKKKGNKKNGKKGYRKRKGSLKKKKIVKPHKYEVEEYIDSDEGTKQPTAAVKEQHREAAVVAGKESSPQHHKDSEDYSNGQQFDFASEADSDAYY